jgi:hypothetical protein
MALFATMWRKFFQLKPAVPSNYSHVMKRLKLLLAGLMCAGLCGCGWPEDDGVHLAECLKAGAQTLQQGADRELTVVFEPLDGTNQIYSVQFCKNSAVVVWSKHGGSSTYQLNFVALPRDFYLHKTNAATWVTLRKEDGRIDVVDAR